MAVLNHTTVFTERLRSSTLVSMFNPLIVMTPEQGALPTLRAAVDPEAAQSAEDAMQLWQVSEQLTCARFELVAANV